jgi:DNA-binding response OmpR family regulator
MKVLLVADSPWVANQVRSALGGTHDIVEVTDPSEAEDVATTAEADVVIIDMQVGSMGGMAITRNIKGVVMSGESPDAPIVLLLDRSADEFIAKRSGADAWLIKPFTSQDLAATRASVA